MSGEDERQPPFNVLLVCTGNICRSALAERLGSAFLADVLGPHADRIRLSSAGTQAVVGAEMHQHTALVLKGFGAEPGEFRARQLDGGTAENADLVLAMTRAHRRVALEAAPRGLARTFTLLEAADLLRILGDDIQLEGTGSRERARRLVAAMAATRSRRSSSEDDDVRDPIGHPLEIHQEVGEVIAEALLPVLTRIVNVADGDDAASLRAGLPEPGPGQHETRL